MSLVAMAVPTSRVAWHGKCHQSILGHWANITRRSMATKESRTTSPTSFRVSQCWSMPRYLCFWKCVWVLPMFEVESGKWWSTRFFLGPTFQTNPYTWFWQVVWIVPNTKHINSFFEWSHQLTFYLTSILMFYLTYINYHHILRHSIWHIFWHVFWHSLWQSILHICLAFYLAFHLAFCPTFYLTFFLALELAF